MCVRVSEIPAFRAQQQLHTVTMQQDSMRGSDSPPSASRSHQVYGSMGLGDVLANDTINSVSGVYTLRSLKCDIAAGMTVAMINIPLSISLAVAAQAHPGTGVITAAWSGIVAALVGGSQYNIVGPTGALSGILAKYTILYGPTCLPWFSISSGSIIGLAYMFELHTYATFLPSAVSQGFTLGVAVIIAGGQVSPALGLHSVHHPDSFLVQLYEVAKHIGNADGYTAAVFVASWGSLYLLLQRWSNIPWSIGIALCGMLLGYLSTQGSTPHLDTLGERFGSLSGSLWLLPERNVALEKDIGGMLQGATSIAFVAVLETVISGRIADGLTGTKMQARQEVLGLGLANLVCGTAGGIPATAALARTALNVRSGAVSRIAAASSAVFTGIVALVLMPAFEHLPLCVVSAILFQVAVGMVETKHLYQAFRIQRSAFSLTAAVALLCLIFDPTIALVVGSVLGLLASAAKAAEGYAEIVHSANLDRHVHFADNHYDSKTHDDSLSYSESASMTIQSWLGQQANQHHQQTPQTAADHNHTDTAPMHHTVVYRLVGDLTYISSLAHQDRIQAISRQTNVIISLRYCQHVDFDGVNTLGEVVANTQQRQSQACMCSVSSIVRSQLLKADWYVALETDGLVFKDTVQALAYIQLSAADVV